jgi:hypothetical protein
MGKDFSVLRTGVIFFSVFFVSSLLAGDRIEDIFPELEGWKKDGTPRIYTPENLYEYINGAAESYLSYDFQKLTTINYEDKEGRSLTIDVYQHSSPANGFGIYSQEKSLQGDFVKVGAHGYYDKGIVNFVMGSTYVKMMSFGIEKEERTFMLNVARKIAAELKEETELPAILTCLPEKGKIENSERYIAQNFLGHGFLHSAFVADYMINDRRLQIFIIETLDISKAMAMVNHYLKHAGEKELSKGDNGSFQFVDRYYRSSGKMNLRWRGRWIWGFFSSDPSTTEYYLNKIGENLSKLN